MATDDHNSSASHDLTPHDPITHDPAVIRTLILDELFELSLSQASRDLTK